jgi:acetyl esterase/lipase
VCVTIEYRLAPAHPDPAILEDCYAGLVWMAEHAGELGVDPAKILVSGISAGGGLSAGVALLARDRKGPSLIGQVLMSPMLDDRSNSLSAHQMDGLGVWDRKTNIQAWTAVLGDRRGTKRVSMYEAPSRSPDLSGLPPAYVDVGSAETFRDEDVQYASKFWRDGIACELHVWPGMCHGFELFFPTLDISMSAKKAKLNWVRRLVTRTELEEAGK